MTTNPPESVEARLSRLEVLFADIGEVVLAQTDTITRLEEATSRNTAAIEALTVTVNEQVAQAAADRQQAAIDRQQATADRQVWQSEIQRIWEYLLRQGGNGRGGNGG